MIDEIELLRRYAKDGSEEAFTELVRQRIDLVYATALRVTGDAHLADEVAQEVFTALARKAPTLLRHPMLSGWLHRSARYAALNAHQRKHRHTQREREIEAMNEICTPTDGHGEGKEIRPLIDGLLDQLNERERHAVILRFLDGCSFAEVGARLRLSEDAARMNVARSLEKLRQLLARRGVASTTVALTVALESHAALTAPVGLAATVSAAALSAPAAAALGGWATFLFMANKTNIIVTGIALVSAGAAFYQTTVNHRQRDELAALRLEQEAGAAKLREGNESLTRVRAELAALRARPPAPALAATPTPNPAPAKPESPGVGHRVIETWHDVGRATPAAAAETLLWAMTTKDHVRAARLMRFTAEEAASMKEIFDSLSEPARQLFGAPEFMYTALLASMGNSRGKPTPNGGEILDETPKGPDEVALRYKMQGDSRVRAVSVRRIEGEWTVMMNMPVTPELRPRWKQMAQEFADDALQKRGANAR